MSATAPHASAAIAAASQDSEAAIVARGLTRRFGEVVAVNGVDLTIPRACVYGFLGPNGSGKSTVLRMLCGLLRPSAGTAHVLGRDVVSDAERLRAQLGYMTQSFSLWIDLSVAENLRFVASIYGLNGRDGKLRIHELAQEFQLQELMSRRAGNLSGGQRQRLALAAATMHRPALLLLDEPTSAVDPQSRRDFWESLFRLVERGSTILVSTHFMDEAERCHRIAILDRGRLVAEGPPRVLAERLSAQVVEVEAAAAGAVRNALQSVDGVRSLVQVGARLRVSMDSATADAADVVRARLVDAGIDAASRRVAPNLEDVFVEATRRETGAVSSER